MIDRARWTVQYYQRVLALDPIAYYPMDEKGGNVGYDISHNGHHGAYTGATLGQAGIGDGRTCPFFDGVNDFLDLAASGLPAAWNGHEYSVSIWAKVFNAADWGPPPIDRKPWNIRVNAANNANLYIWSGGANRMYISTVNGGVAKAFFRASNELTWMHWVITLSESADRLRMYFGGAQAGADVGGLGVWVGVPTLLTIGAHSVIPNNMWHGWLAHAAFWDRELSPAQVAGLAVA